MNACRQPRNELFAIVKTHACLRPSTQGLLPRTTDVQSNSGRRDSLAGYPVPPGALLRLGLIHAGLERAPLFRGALWLLLTLAQGIKQTGRPVKAARASQPNSFSSKRLIVARSANNATVPWVLELKNNFLILLFSWQPKESWGCRSGLLIHQ